jgi:hypothetical protein
VSAPSGHLGLLASCWKGCVENDRFGTRDWIRRVEIDRSTMAM